MDQQAERIIFVQEDENTITSYVEIQYQGAPDAFAWIVPVPAVPDLDTWQSMAFNALDLVTEPQWNFQDDCFFLEADAPAANGGAEDGGDPVIVLDQQRVGPFDTVTLQSADPRELVQWLRDNEYRIVPAMEPFIALYTAENMKFLAMKLAPGEDTDAIQPIGGTALLHGTLEVRKYTLDGYGIALFNDWGMVWNRLDEFDPLEVLPTAGIGLRYKSPIGAIRLDTAYRFNVESMFDLEPTLQLHFGLSEAF